MKRIIVFVSIFFVMSGRGFPFEIGVVPLSYEVDSVYPGDRIRLEPPLSVINKNPTSASFSLRVKKAPGDFFFDYIPDESWVSFDETTFVVPAKSTRSINIYLSIPPEEEYFNQHYRFMIRTGGRGTVSAGFGTIVTVSTASNETVVSCPKRLCCSPGEILFAPGETKKRFVVMNNDPRQSVKINFSWTTDISNPQTSSMPEGVYVCSNIMFWQIPVDNIFLEKLERKELYLVIEDQFLPAEKGYLVISSRSSSSFITVMKERE
ncbi:hypothetical protein J7K18_00645 [bacterium]|nr:hypothetical protein [bacterium]